MARKRSDDKRRRILQAAVKVFARKGYFAARVAEIAKRAGVADGTIYLYFRGKEDILVSLFDELMAEHVERARAEMQAVEDAPSRLRLIAEHHLRALGADRDVAVVFQVYPFEVPPRRHDVEGAVRAIDHRQAWGKMEMPAQAVCPATLEHVGDAQGPVEG